MLILLMRKVTISIVFKWSLIAAPGAFLFWFDTAVISGVEEHIRQLFHFSSFYGELGENLSNN
jgi:hypothetical protein